MLKVGITGGIGSGKTTVCGIFEALGIPVYNADSRAKYLMQHDPVLITAIVNEFGDKVYDEQQNLNRELLAEIVFSDETKLKKLNSMVHPAVFKDHALWLESLKEKNIPYTLKEAALLVETGAYKRLDKLIVVTAPIEKRLKRITTRDKTSEKKVMDRVNAQLNDEAKLKVANFIIVNDGSLEELQAKVNAIHQQLLSIKK